MMMIGTTNHLLYIIDMVRQARHIVLVLRELRLSIYEFHCEKLWQGMSPFISLRCDCHYDNIVWALYLCLALTSAFFSMRNLSMRLNVSNVCDLPIIYFGCVCHHEWAFVCFCGCSDICIRLVLLVLLFGRTYERSGLFGIWYYYYAISFRLLRHAWNWSGDGSTDGLTGCQSDYARWV